MKFTILFLIISSFHLLLPQSKEYKSKYIKDRISEQRRAILYLSGFAFSVDEVKKNRKKLLNEIETLRVNQMITPEVLVLFQNIFENHKSLPQDLVILALESIYRINHVQFSKSLETVFMETLNKKVLLLSYLNLKKYKNLDKKFDDKISKYNDEKIQTILDYLNTPHKKALPPLEPLLAFKNSPEDFIFYSFHPSDTLEPGYLIIKGKDGKFLREKDGKLFVIKQLARSVLELPSLMEMGDTPGGLYSLGKIIVSSNPKIGPVPAIKLSLPHEVSPAAFFHLPKEIPWTKEIYSSFLPQEWKEYPSLWESYFAGYIGRSGIWMHGSTLDPEAFSDYLKVKITPTYGCLSSREEWSEEGRLLLSDQRRLIEKLPETLGGFAFVIRIPSRELPDLERIEKIILELER
ncbi:MAG: hypothetical protein H7A24_03900 [Leptospiraceae bacterium]|nr:hypothetical protein [Leptospiraceae bacterium]MCP5510996.1 hypothetical protein [Leptospiraceae bacterium]